LKPDASNFLSASYNGENSIREIIMKKKVQVRSIAQDPNDPEKDLVIVIKPSSKCNYKNVIDMLDEMSINIVKKYALVDIFDIEEQLVQKSDANAKSSSN
jgi:phospholipid N-methyltransferase